MEAAGIAPWKLRKSPAPVSSRDNPDGRGSRTWAPRLPGGTSSSFFMQTPFFRPVMLTSLTTFIGLAPLLLEKATQAQFLIPMAVSLGFGIIFATFVTLILVPVNFIVLEDLRRGLRRLRGGVAGSVTET